MKILIAPFLILIASLLGRRWGNSVGGWLIALPLTSAPAAYLLAHDQGLEFAQKATVGMLTGTASQVLFALFYFYFAGKFGPAISLFAGIVGFAFATLILAWWNLAALPAFGVVLVSLLIGLVLISKSGYETNKTESKLPAWDLPVRMAAATVVVYLITEFATFLGAHIVGLLSPFPIFAAVLAFFAHINHGANQAKSSLHGLLVGLFTPAIFFFTLSITLVESGYKAFAYATFIALTFQVISGRYLLQRR